MAEVELQEAPNGKTYPRTPRRTRAAGGVLREPPFRNKTMTRLPEKLDVENDDTYSTKRTINALIDYLAEREGVDWAKPSETKKHSIWDLNKLDGEEYWGLGHKRDIVSHFFNSFYDENARAEGNAFLTREAAEAEHDRRREMAKGL